MSTNFGEFIKPSTPAKSQSRFAVRTKMVVPVRLFAQSETGEQAMFLAHTLDASTAGARLGGFHGRVRTGQTVTVQYQHRRSNFRVIWIGKHDTPQATQIGLQCLDPGKNIWNMDGETTGEQRWPGRMTS